MDKKANYKEVTSCLCCDSKDLHRFLDLGLQPLANNNTKESYKQETYPLEVMVCQECWHQQLSVSINPEILFENYDYVSGTTETLRKHFNHLALITRQRLPLASTHLDIAANDGSLSSAFDARGFCSFGVDPAKNLQIESFKKAIPVLVDYWSEDLGRELEKKYDVITACNVLAHNSNPYGFLKGIYHALKTKGVAVVEFPLYKNTVLFNDLGQHYHEHLSYFSVNSFKTLTERVGFGIFDIQDFPNIHGGTVRFWLEKHGGHSTKVGEYLTVEGLAGLYEMKTHLEFAKQIEINIEELSNLLLVRKQQGRTIITYGASAKSSTLFNHKLMKKAITTIDFIVDDNSKKLHKFAPGSCLPIKPTSTIYGCRDIDILLTVHNFKQEVLNRLRHQNISGNIVNYVPLISLEEF